MFDPNYESDLVAVAPDTATDVLSQFLKNHWMFLSKPEESSSARRGPRVGYFSAHYLALLASVCSTPIAAPLLIGPILALYIVTDPDVRLALVIAFIVVFAVGLSVSTGAARDSIFAATAAYTAVMVVFVLGDLGNARTGEKPA